MTSDEVLTALRCCASDNCNGCPSHNRGLIGTSCIGKYSSERLADMLAKKMLESGAITIKERPAAGKFGGSELRATVYVAFPQNDGGYVT